MTPISFGAAERRLFGIYHAAQMQAPGTRPAVVLCNAFGQEAIRAHRFQRSLAERLARAGHAVLRFDYFGAGESMGEDIDGDLEGWSQDLRTAHEELRRRSDATRMIWIGMRLGGTVALQAAHAAPMELAKLVLWDPIIDGTRYLEYLRERHIASLESEYSLPLKPAPRELARDPKAFCDEAIGFALSPRLRTQLSSIRIETHVWPATPADISVLTDPSTAEGRDLEQVLSRLPERVQRFVVQHGTNWTTDTAGDTALVPTAALMTITQQAGEAK